LSYIPKIRSASVAPAVANKTRIGLVHTRNRLVTCYQDSNLDWTPWSGRCLLPVASWNPRRFGLQRVISSSSQPPKGSWNPGFGIEPKPPRCSSAACDQFYTSPGKTRDRQDRKKGILVAPWCSSISS